MTPLVAYRAGRALVKARLLGRPTPLVVGWSITDRCNSRCRYCARWKRSGRELTTAQATAIIDELAELGCLRVSLTGGEPLVRPDLPVLLARLRRAGVGVSLNSNGALVREHLNAIDGTARLVLSLDGPPALHDAIRGAGSYRQVMDAVDAALGRGIPFQLTTVLSAANLERIGFLLDLATSLRTRVQFQPATANLLGGQDANLLRSPVDAYRATLAYLVRERRRGHPAIAHSVSTLERLREWPDRRPMRCACGLISARIETSGEVLHCSRARPLAPPRNAAEVGFAAAFHTLGPRTCDDCYCASRIELNLAYRLDRSAIVNQLRR